MDRGNALYYYGLSRRGEIMIKFEVEDVVLVYKDTPTFKDGTIAQVIDRDPEDNSYAVADLRDIGKANKDLGIILTHYVKWVKPENMYKLSFDRPETSSRAIGFVIGIVLGLFILGMYAQHG